MAVRPTVDDLAVRVGGLTPDPDSEAYGLLVDAFDAAIALIESRLRDDAIPDDTNAYPAEVRAAVLILAKRFYRRKDTPEGIGGFGDLGPYRILPTDGDVEVLINRRLRLDGFA